MLSGERVSIPPADVYLLAAWHSVYSQLLGLNGKIGVLWTSSVGEMDLEPVEQVYLMQIIRDPRISFIWFGDANLAEVYPEKGFYAPYPLEVDGVSLPEVEKSDIATLFCPAGPKKNLLNQILAMKIVQREMKLTLHTNVEGYDLYLGERELDCVRHSWLPTEEYKHLLASAKVNLACSWCETFNYNVAEAALLGTTSVVSPTVPLPGTKVDNPNSPLQIAAAIMSVVRIAKAQGESSRSHLQWWARQRNEGLMETLSERLSNLP